MGRLEETKRSDTLGNLGKTRMADNDLPWATFPPVQSRVE
jgi:hypothetical protein